MQNAIIPATTPAIFNFDDSQIRTITKDGEPWFFAQDLAVTLGYSGTAAMLKRIDDDEQQMQTFLDGTTYKKQTLINESGMYNAVLGSQLDSARRFKKWITSEVLPAIRKTGGYHLPQTLHEALALAAEQAKLLFEQNLLVEEMKPKADFFDTVTTSNDLCDMATVAKVLAIPFLGRNTLFQILRNLHVLQHDNRPYQKYVDRGYFKVTEKNWSRPKTQEVKVSFKTEVTQKGLDFLRALVTTNIDKDTGKWTAPIRWALPERK